MKKDLVNINEDSKLMLNRAKNLMSVTNKLLIRKDNEWINTLLNWFKNNIIQESTYYPINEEQLMSLRKLSLRWNRLDSLPEELFYLNRLETLELNNNNLKYIPSKISYLSNLKVLNLNINNLKELPEDIIELRNLEVLNIKNNKYLELNSQQLVWLNKIKTNGCHLLYDKYKFKIGE